MRESGRVAWLLVVATAVWLAYGALVGPGQGRRSPPGKSVPEVPAPGSPSPGVLERRPPPPLATSPRNPLGTRGTDAPEGPASPAPRGVTVPLRLVRADGRAVDRATVRVGDEETPHVWDPRTRTVDLPRGRHTIHVLAGRYGEWRTREDLEVDVRPEMAAVDVTLEPWRMVVGRLTSTVSGSSVPAEVRLRPVDRAEAEPTDPVRPEPVDLRPPSEGWFCFGREFEVQPGTYEVSAAPWPWGPIRATREVVVRDGPAYVELDLPPAERSDGVFLTVLDPEGRPDTPAWITLDVRDAQGGGGGGRATAEALGDGRFWIPTLLPGYSGQDPVDVTLWVGSDAYGQRRTDIPVARAVAPVVVRFEPPADVRLTIEGRDEWLGAGDVVEAWLSAPNGARRLGRTSLSPEGVATFRALQPGEVVFTVTGTGPAGELRIGVARIAARSGENDVRTPAPTLHRLRILGAGRGISIAATDDSGTRGHLVAPGGELDVRLPAGTYMLRSGSRGATAEVPATAEVTLTER